MSDELTLVKLGGSVITDKTQPYTERQGIIDRLAEELKKSRKHDPKRDLVVGHGGGSYPHQSASKYKTHKGIINQDSYEGIVKVQKDASDLNKIVVDSMIDKGLNAMSFSPSGSCIAKNGEIESWNLKPIKKALEMDLVPVPYGDVALDKEKGCCILSTEKILSYLAEELGGASKVILTGKVEGIFTADPTEDPEAELISKITPENYSKIKDYLTGSEGEDVTGGALHKVKQCLKLARKGVECQVITAEELGNLEKAIDGDREIGTLITQD